MASGVMTIHYQSSAIRIAAERAADEFDSARRRIVDVRRSLDSMEEHSSRRYLDQASAFLRKKERQYDAKANSLRELGRRADGLMDEARATDRRVANHLDMALRTFEGVTGLRTGYLATLSKFLVEMGEALVDMGKILLRITLYTICPVLGVIRLVQIARDFYDSLPEEVKYIIKLTVAAVGLVFAVVTLIVATGPLAIISGAIGLVVALTGALKAFAAYDIYKTNPEAARMVDAMSKSQFFGICMEGIGLGDSEFWAGTFVAMEIVGIVTGLGALAQNAGLFKAGQKTDYAALFGIDDFIKGKQELSTIGALIRNNASITRILTSDVTNLTKAISTIWTVTNSAIDVFFFKPVDDICENFLKDVILENIPIIGDFYKGGKSVAEL